MTTPPEGQSGISPVEGALSTSAVCTTQSHSPTTALYNAWVYWHHLWASFQGVQASYSLYRWPVQSSRKDPVKHHWFTCRHSWLVQSNRGDRGRGLGFGFPQVGDVSAGP